MCPQTDPREPENGENPASGKIQNITPEWQTEQKTSVDSAVARVKGKHHDGDVLSWTASMPSNQVVPRTFSSCVDEKVFLFIKQKRKPRTIRSSYKRENKKCTKEYNIITLRRNLHVRQSPQ